MYEDHGEAPVLTAELAQEIASDIGRIIGFNVLITDRAAVVIGCGDPSRVGTVHEASHQVVAARKAMTHTAGQARRLRGVKPGISLPIIVGAEVIGTVCLTGQPAEVRPFGLVVQRQTELLLEEATLLRSRLLHDRAVDDFLRDVALFDPEVADPDTVEARGAELGMTPGVPRTAVVLHVRADSGGPAGTSRGPAGTSRGPAGTSGSPAGTSRGPAWAAESPAAVPRISLLRTVREFFGGSQDIAGEIIAGRYAALHAADTGPGDLAGRADLAGRGRLLADLIGERHGLAARIAIGEPGTGVAGMHTSYRHAAAALRIGPVLDPDGRVFTVTDLRIPQLVATAARQERTEYAGSVLGGLRGRADWPALRETLLAWCEGGFNLVRTAERLHIHRNTLLYRLGKLEQASGRPIREPRQAIAAYLACLADLLDHEL